MNSPLTATCILRTTALFAAAIAPLLPFVSAPATGAEAPRGQNLFERRCGGCHQLDDVRVGPRLRGVFGRAAGSDTGFSYSSALKSSRLTWDEKTLDRWLTDTEALVPDNNMAFRVPAAGERAEIIAYLKGLSR